MVENDSLGARPPDLETGRPAVLIKCYQKSYDRDVRLAVVEMFAAKVLEVQETHPLLIEALLDEEPDIAKAAVD